MQKQRNWRRENEEEGSVAVNLPFSEFGGKSLPYFFYLALKKKIDIRLDIVKVYVIPGICAIIMGVVAFITYDLFAIIIRNIISREYFINLFAALTAILVAIVVYAILMIALKGATETELLELPKGAKIVRFLRKVHLLK